MQPFLLVYLSVHNVKIIDPSLQGSVAGFQFCIENE